MAENFITVPVTDLDGDNIPTTLTNAILHTTGSLTGLTNGTAYRAFVLQTPSPSFTPSVSFAPGDDTNLWHWYNETSVTVDGSNQVTLWTDLAGGGPGTMNLNIAAADPAVTFNALNRTAPSGLTVVEIGSTAANFLRSTPNILDIGRLGAKNFAFHGVVQVDEVTNAGQAFIATSVGANNFAIDANSATQFDGRLQMSSSVDVSFTGGTPPFFTNWSTYSIVGDATAQTLTVYVNNQQRAQATGLDFAQFTADRIRLSSINGSLILSHAVGEFMITGSIDNVTSYHDYLVARWGVVV